MPEMKEDPRVQMQRLERAMNVPHNPRDEDDLPKMLRVWRALADMNQTDAALLLDLSQIELSRIERGLRPTAEVERRIRDLLGLPKK